jgi:hypothetical protein
MKIALRRGRSVKANNSSNPLDQKLASYLAATASIGTVMASEAKAIVISNPTVQTVGINEFANIDFNSDGQIDFQIDHDRVDLTAQGGPIVDYLQLDKNDINGASPGENPLAFDPLTNFQAATFPPNNTVPNDTNEFGHFNINPPNNGANLEYPAALLAGAEIGPIPNYDYQEGENVYNSGDTGHLNRLIDEDHGQIDMLLGGKSADQILVPTNTPQFLGVVNEVRYLGVKMDLNNAAATNDLNLMNYGWIGIKITNEADATAQVVGYGYETQAGVAILAGDTGARAGDYNDDGKVDAADYVMWRNGGPLENETATPGTVTQEDFTAWQLNFGGTATIPGSGFGAGAGVPEPGSGLLALLSGIGLVIVYICRRIRGK